MTINSQEDWDLYLYFFYMRGVWDGFRGYIKALLDVEKYGPDDLEYWYAQRNIAAYERMYYKHIFEHKYEDLKKNDKNK